MYHLNVVRKSASYFIRLKCKHSLRMTHPQVKKKPPEMNGNTMPNEYIVTLIRILTFLMSHLLFIFEIVTPCSYNQGFVFCCCCFIIKKKKKHLPSQL